MHFQVLFISCVRQLAFKSCNLLITSFRVIHKDALKESIEYAGGDFMKKLAAAWDHFLDEAGSWNHSLKESNVRTVPIHGP